MWESVQTGPASPCDHGQLLASSWLVKGQREEKADWFWLSFFPFLLSVNSLWKRAHRQSKGVLYQGLGHFSSQLNDHIGPMLRLATRSTLMKSEVWLMSTHVLGETSLGFRMAPLCESFSNGSARPTSAFLSGKPRT